MKRPFAVTVCMASLVMARGALVLLPPALSVQVSNSAVGLRIRGNVGNTCTIQYRDGLSPADNWQFLTNLILLSSSPFVVVDTSRTRLFILLTRVRQGLWQKSAREAVPVRRERSGNAAGSIWC